MASQRYSGFINKLVSGTEKSEGYARATLPSNRWELFWDVFKGRFGKLFLINLLTLLFFIPLALIFFLNYVSIAGYGTAYPFAAGFGVGYQAPVSMAGLAEDIVFKSNLITFLLLPIGMVIASLGLSGGLYIIRNMVWTEGIFVANDFWRGIAQNAKQMIMTALIYSFCMYLTILSVSLAKANIAGGVPNAWLYYLLIAVSIIIFVFITLVVFHMMTLCVTYEYKYTHLVKNAVLFTVANPITSIFFIALGALPFLFLLMGSFMRGVGTIICLILGFSLLMLVWTVFCQYLYDRFLNDKVKGAKKNRGIYEKVKNDKSESIKRYKEQMEISFAQSNLSNRPIKPITDDEIKLAELPQSFSRSDIEKLNESRKALYEDNERYVAEHSADEKYLMAEKGKEKISSQEEERQKRIEKAKRELEKRNKRK